MEKSKKPSNPVSLSKFDDNNDSTAIFVTDKLDLNISKNYVQEIDS
jgi:hypothetical protein